MTKRNRSWTSGFWLRHSFVIRNSCFGICLLILAAGISVASAQERNITEKDLFDFVWIGDPQISPDGSRVAFVRVTVNDKKEGYNTSIWSVPMAGGEEPHQLTKGDHDSTPRWSPDGKYLLVLLGRAQEEEIFSVRRPEGRKARRAAIVDLADGWRGFIFLYRSAKGRRQSGLVAGWKNDRVHQ